MPRAMTVLTFAMTALSAQAPAPDAGADGDARVAELLKQAGDGALDVAAALAALGAGDEGLRTTAAAVVRHTWAMLPPALFDGLDREPRAAHALLAELAIAPRPAATAWVVRWSENTNRTREERLLALAARGEPIGAKEARTLVEALADETGEGFLAACRALPSEVADGLVGRLHAGLARDAFPVDRCVPLLDRLSVAGTRRLLGLVVTLPAGVGGALAQRVAERLPQVMAERAADALDHDPVVDSVWLRYAAKALTTPARCERVLAVLRDTAAGDGNRQLAFFALVEAKQIGDEVLDYAETLAEAFLPRVLATAVECVPEPRLIAWLDRGEQSARAVVMHLSARRTLGAELEAKVLRMTTAAHTVDGVFFRLATAALLQRGAVDTVQALWPLLRRSKDFADFVDLLSRRREPFVTAQLLAEFAAPAPEVAEPDRRHQLDALALALCALGDLRELPRLVAGARSASPAWLRRCRAAVTRLPHEPAMTLLRDALGDAALGLPATVGEAVVAVADHDTGVELLDWAATAAAHDDEVRAALLGWWRRPAPALAPDADDEAVERAAQFEELQDVAMRGLVRSPCRARLATELRAAIAAGPLAAATEASAFELLATMPSPPVADDLALCAEILLLRPCADPARERHLAERWQEGVGGFPLVSAVTQRLRGADPVAVEAAFRAVAAQALANPRCCEMAPGRFLLLWRSLAFDLELQRAVGCATAALALRLDAPALHPSAAFFAALDADRRGDHAAARVQALAALPLAIDPTQRLNARTLLGDRDVEERQDPLAALAAAPYLHDHLRAVAAGDPVAAARTAALVRELAGRDAATLARLQQTTR